MSTLLSFANIERVGELKIEEPEDIEAGKDFMAESPSYEYLKSNGKAKEMLKEMKDEMERNAEYRNFMNRRTDVDRIMDQMNMKLIQITFIFFTFFYLIVKDFGETNYIIVIILITFIIWYGIGSIAIKETISIENDHHLGWNFSLNILSSGITQVMVLTILMFLYEISRRSISIHPWDTVMYLIIYVIQWAGIVIFTLICFHFYQQITFFIDGVYDKMNEPIVKIEKK